MNDTQKLLLVLAAIQQLADDVAAHDDCADMFADAGEYARSLHARVSEFCADFGCPIDEAGERT